MSEEKVIKRGYVKWIDENGEFHKEPLADHPELLAKARPVDQLRAEEARRLNAAAEERLAEDEVETQVVAKEVLEELKAAPEEVLTAAQLDEPVVEETKPASAAEEPVADERQKALDQLRKDTASEG